MSRRPCRKFIARNLEEQEEPEDTLMDLLYFVVDILQFQGERNAYDEIQGSDSHGNRWRALSSTRIVCLGGRAASSSRAASWRVLQFRKPSSGTIVDRNSGAFILNPTGDLRTTQVLRAAAVAEVEE
jgi:separase